MTKAGSQALRIASYNIRKAIGLDWRRDPARIADVLAEIGADVVVLQEADRRLGTRSGVMSAEILHNMLGYAIAPVALRPDSHGWHGNVILYRAEALRLATTARIDIPAIEPRGAISALFIHPRLEVVGVHLALTQGVRRRQLARLAEHLCQADHPVVVAGDFNMWARDPTAEEIFAGAGEFVLPGKSFHASRPVAALDRFILTPGLVARGKHVHHSPTASRASDHLPIVLDVELTRDAS